MDEETMVENYKDFDGLGRFGITNEHAIRTGNKEGMRVASYCAKKEHSLACLEGAKRAINVNEHSNYDRHKAREKVIDDAIEL